jgi:hypothetical protein
MSRACGDCQLCCKLMPVRSVGKGAHERCKHQRHHKGCAVYANLWRVSPECKLWNCAWLGDESTAALSRPDRSHYVIDIMPDFITVNDPVQGRQNVQVLQIWCDPDYPDAHRDPALRAFIERRGMAALVRYDNERAVVLMPPSMMSSGQWSERSTDLNRNSTHTFAQIVEALTGNEGKQRETNEVSI